MIEKKAFEETKMMILIRHLNEKEFKNLGLWVHSPIHNSSKKVIKLYDILKKYHKTGKALEAFTLMRNMNILAKGAKRKDISEKNEQDLRQIMSLLTIQIEDFLIWKKGKENNIGGRRLLMDALLEKQLFKLVRTAINKTQKKYEFSIIRDIDYCVDAYKLAEMEYYMDIILQNRGSATSLQKTVVALEQSCLSQLLRYYCALLNTKRIVKIDDFPFMEAVKKYIENNGERQMLVVEAYYQLLKVLENQQPKDYYALKTKLFESLEVLNVHEIRGFFNAMTNYCTRKFKNGEEEFMQEKFKVYKNYHN